MPASRFVVSVFASTDAEIFWPAAAKPRLMPDASMDDSFLPRSGASNLPMHWRRPGGLRRGLGRSLRRLVEGRRVHFHGG